MDSEGSDDESDASSDSSDDDDDDDDPSAHIGVQHTLCPVFVASAGAHISCDFARVCRVLKGRGNAHLPRTCATSRHSSVPAS